MTRAVGDDDSLLKSLQEVVGLFKDAQTSVFKLMSSVSCSSHTLFNFGFVADCIQGLRPEISQGTQIRRRTGPAQL